MTHQLMQPGTLRQRIIPPWPAGLQGLMKYTYPGSYLIPLPFISFISFIKALFQIPIFNTDSLRVISPFRFKPESWNLEHRAEDLAEPCKAAKISAA